MLHTWPTLLLPLPLGGEDAQQHGLLHPDDHEAVPHPAPAHRPLRARGPRPPEPAEDAPGAEAALPGPHPPLTSWSHGQLLLALVSPSLHSLNGNHRSHIHICSYLKLSLLTPLGSHPHWRPGWWPEETLRPPDRGGLAAICLVTATAAPASWRHEATRIRDPDKREASDYGVP